ncbi:MAG TPA: DNA mismatch repair protein MutS [Dehalococcoidia bacterium]
MTPIRRQYLDIKRRYPHAIVFFRLGDFYETFDEDAKLVSRELEIVLTSKPMGHGERVPLAGIPYHAVEGYLSRLIAKGYKVALCEQMSDPATTKGIVERQVVRVVTPGTVVESNLLDERANNYIVALAPPPIRRGSSGASLWAGEAPIGIAYADVSTGEFVAGDLSAAALSGELMRLRPAELLMSEDVDPLEPAAELRAHITRTPVPSDWFLPAVAEGVLREHFTVASSEAFGVGQGPAVAAAGALLKYLIENQRSSLSNITRLQALRSDGFMTLDPATRRNLELFAGGRQARREHSLLGVLDCTKTALGARLLGRRIGQPLLDLGAIDARLDQVQFFCGSAVRHGKTQELLSQIPDLERLVGRIVQGVAQPRELVALRRGLELTPSLREIVSDDGAEAAVVELASRLRPCEDVVAAIATAIADEPGVTLEHGDVVRAGYSQELDSLRAIARDTKRFVAELELAERERTGIKSLRIGHNRVFGYYLEVTKANLEAIPNNYERRQTLVGAERYVTPQLKEYETRILTARECCDEIEGQVFRQVCAQVVSASGQVLALAAAIAELDVAAGLAEAAALHNYVRPELHDGDEFTIRDGRHPVVERTLANATPTSATPPSFVPNDTTLSGAAQIVVITGPNMAGKSTYLRQVALIVLMAQIGSYVPAASARIGLVDRIFTRVGAQDDLASGQSTFMVEMLEAANILHNATPRSLVILDEIGRGTSTYDGMAIARAVVEYLHNKPDVTAKTLFATHYHELVELAHVLPRVRNENVAVADDDGRIVFLHKIVPGGADKSYGVHVAELAGLPKTVVQRARELLVELERGALTPNPSPQGRGEHAAQLPLLSQRSPLLDELASLDVDGLSPLEALQKLYELRERATE